MTENELKLLAQLLAGNLSSNKITIEEAFNNYLKYATVRCRPDTIAFYLKLWKVLVQFYNQYDIKFINDIDNNIMINLQYWLKASGYSNNSINKFTDTLKMVIKYNYENGFINEFKIATFKKLKKDFAETIIVENDVRSKILNYLETLPNSDLFNLRNKLIIYIFDETGIRLNELLEIKRKNVLVEPNTIHLDFTKTGRPRDVFVSNETAYLINLYLSKTDTKQKYFFLNLIDNSKMGKISVYKFLDKLKRILDINQSITPHKWRHTLATNLMNSNAVNIKQVQNVLGHTQLSTTQKYLHSSKNETRARVLNVLEKQKNMS